MQSRLLIWYFTVWRSELQNYSISKVRNILNKNVITDAYASEWYWKDESYSEEKFIHYEFMISVFVRQPIF